MTTTKYTTRSGITLEFTVLPKESTWNNVSGIYAFCGQAPNGSYTVHYIGQARSFEDRIPNHERWDEARRSGASVVLATVVPLQGDRDKLEAELIGDLQPPLNTAWK